MLQTADEHMQRIADAGDNRYQQDSRLIVQFSIEAVEDAEASAKAGRPIYQEVEFVEITTPGDRNNILHRPVQERDRARFTDRYERWKRKTDGEEKLSGTPLKVWPQVTRAQVEELAYFKIFTVDQLASINDTALRNFPGALGLRQKARDFVEVATKGAAASQMRAELEKRDGTIQVMQRQMEEMAAELQRISKAKEK